jgi:hypothetical protein
MGWLLLITATAAGLMLWRDLKSGRIYAPNRYQPFDYDSPEHFETKSEWPFLFRIATGLIGGSCLYTFLAGALSFVIPEEKLVRPALVYLLIFAVTILILYLVYGVMGRLFSWIKNYGSVDKKW